MDHRLLIKHHMHMLRVYVDGDPPRQVSAATASMKSWLTYKYNIWHLYIPNNVDMGYLIAEARIWWRCCWYETHCNNSWRARMRSRISYFPIHTYIYIYIHTNICIYVYLYTHICIYMYIYIYIYIYTYIYTYICIFIYLYIFIYMWYIHMYTYVYNAYILTYLLYYTATRCNTLQYFREFSSEIQYLIFSNSPNNVNIKPRTRSTDIVQFWGRDPQSGRTANNPFQSRISIEIVGSYIHIYTYT